MSSITCCFECAKRHPHCHSSCEEYAAQKAEYEKFKDYMAKIKEQYNDQICVLIKNRPIKSVCRK